MPFASDIILVGAGRHPLTKQLRQLRQPRSRNRWIGTIQITTGLRIPVNVEYVRQHFQQITSAIEDGVLLVEYKTDGFVDVAELTTLVFGDDAARAAYDKKLSDLVEADAAAQREKELQRKANEDAVAHANELARQLRGSRLAGSQEGPADDPVKTGEEDDDLTPEELEERANALSDPYVNNLDGTHAIHAQDELEVADEAAKVLEDGELDSSPKTEEAAPAPEAVQEVPPPPARDFKSLPDGWKASTKNDLLALCEERGIDVSDVPSNRVLKQRLEEYEAGRS